MSAHRSFCARLARDTRGTMAVETAFVAPILVLMGLGTFDVSEVVAKQQDLQSAANEATQIVLASTNAKGITSTQIHDIIASSLNIDSGKVTVDALFRCDDAATTVSDSSSCDASKPIYQYVKITIVDSYTPLWTTFGVGHTLHYNVARTVEVA